MRLTDRLIKSLPGPAVGAKIAYDEELPGFGVRVTSKGVRSFVLNYVVAGRERRLTIGRFPTWSTTAAREEARQLKRQVDIGIDPLAREADEAAKAAAERALPSVRDLFTRYMAEHLPRKAPRAAADDRSMWEQIILPRLGDLKVRHVTHEVIDALHAEVSRTRPVRANRVIEVIRKAFNLAIRWGWRSDNPASGVHRNHEQKRSRYLTGAEVMKLCTALATHPERTSANAIRLLMLTGARRGEVLGARWDMFDLEAGVWIKPSAHTKQRKEHRVPLSAAARQLLREILLDATGKAAAENHSVSPFLFAGRDGRPINDIKRTWLSVCRKAGLAEQTEKQARDRRPFRSRTGEPAMAWRASVRVHDLRHTYASILASQGLSLPVIGALLGHTQPNTTARYAHLLDDPLRAATERVGAYFTENGATSAGGITGKQSAGG